MKSLLIIVTLLLVAVVVVMTIPQSGRLHRFDIRYYRLFGSQDSESQLAPVTVEAPNSQSNGPNYEYDPRIPKNNGASPLKAAVKGPADLGIYFINTPGRK